MLIATYQCTELSHLTAHKSAHVSLQKP